MTTYRELNEGEIIQSGDEKREFDPTRHRPPARWFLASATIGMRVGGHEGIYRRPILEPESADIDASGSAGEVSDTVLGEWVYCDAHLAAHKSGWCTVPLDDKIGLGPDVTDQLSADNKCRRFGLRLYVDLRKCQPSP